MSVSPRFANLLEYTVQRCLVANGAGDNGTAVCGAADGETFKPLLPAIIEMTFDFNSVLPVLARAVVHHASSIRQAAPQVPTGNCSCGG